MCLYLFHIFVYVPNVLKDMSAATHLTEVLTARGTVSDPHCNVETILRSNSEKCPFYWAQLADPWLFSCDSVTSKRHWMTYISYIQDQCGMITLIGFNVMNMRTLLKCCSHLTQRGRVTHIWVNRLTIIGSNDGLLPVRRQDIIWTNAEILWIGQLGRNLSES